jgi:hypothetical protein
MGQATLARPPVVPLVPSESGNFRTTLVLFATAINRVLRGGISATLEVTLAPGDVTSVFSDSRIGPFTYIGLSPSTASAAAALPSIWIETTRGSATIHHASSANTDQTFVACLLG